MMSLLVLIRGLFISRRLNLTWRAGYEISAQARRSNLKVRKIRATSYPYGHHVRAVQLRRGDFYANLERMSIGLDVWAGRDGDGPSTYTYEVCDIREICEKIAAAAANHEPRPKYWWDLS